MTDSKSYNALMLDHYRHPRNFGNLERPDIAHEESNTMCGDRIRIEASISQGMLTDVRFKGRGCAISIAAASMLTEMLKGRSIMDLKDLTDDDMLKALGIPVKRTRLNCALLGLKVFRKAAFGSYVEDDLMK